MKRTATAILVALTLAAHANAQPPASRAPTRVVIVDHATPPSQSVFSRLMQLFLW